MLQTSESRPAWALDAKSIGIELPSLELLSFQSISPAAAALPVMALNMCWVRPGHQESEEPCHCHHPHHRSLMTASMGRRSA